VGLDVPAGLTIAAISYGAASVAYVILAIVLLTRWRARLAGSLLVPAVSLSAVWTAVIVGQTLGLNVPLPVVLGLEVARDGAWLIFLLRILTASDAQSLPRWLRHGIYGLTALAFVAVCAGAVLRDLGWIARSAVDLFMPAALALALIGFILVDHGYRNTRPGEAWAAKFLWLAVGGMFVFDLLLYATSMMYGGLPLPLWETRGAALALLVPMLAIGVSRLGTRPAGQFLSRQFVFYTTGVTAAGMYLLAVALGGYYLRVAGGSWGGFAQSVFLFGATLLLAVLLASGQARAWLRVFVAKHLSPYKHDYRAEWLRLVRNMVAASEDRPLPERAIGALAQLVNADAGGLWVLRDAEYTPVGGDLGGPDMATEPAASPFVRALIDHEWIVDLNPADAERAGVQPVPIPKWLGALARARYVVPLLQERELVGFVVIAQPLVAHALNWEDIDLLRTAGRQVASYIALDHAAQALARAQQFEAYNRFVAFIMHDVKNLIAQQQLVVENAARHKGNPQFVDDAIATIENSVRRMTRLLEQLRRGETGAGTRRVNLAELCNDVATRCSGREPSPALDVSDPSLEVVLAPERFANVLENVVRNAQDATPTCGSVRIAVSRGECRAVVEVSDDGQGMDAAFVRDRLFRPFDTTKGSQGMGIGAYQAREFVRSLGGDIQVHSEPGKGTRFVIELPVLEGSGQ
jgi:putative PEP-CTERM system histidine kinase